MSLVCHPHTRKTVWSVTAGEWGRDAGHHFGMACRCGLEMIAKAHRPVVCLRDLRRQQAPFVVKGLRGGAESGAGNARRPLAVPRLWGMLPRSLSWARGRMHCPR